MSDKPDEPEKTIAEPEVIAASPNRFEKLLRTCKWRLQWLFPNTFHPYKGDRAYRAKRDLESNAASKVSEDEELRLRVIWVTELYGPAQSEQLYQRLERLKWSAGFGRSENASHWVREQRDYGFVGGSWYNVGLVVGQKDSSRFIGPDNKAALPEEVDYMLVRVRQSTPSLTCVVAGFVLKDSAASTYEEILNRTYKSTQKRSRHWRIATLDPSHQRRHAIDQARAKTRRLAEDWFRENLPGFFCSRPPGRMPTSELITSRSSIYLSRDDNMVRELRHGWRKRLVNTSDLDVWTHAQSPAVQLTLRELDHDDERFHMVVTVNAAALKADELKTWGGEDSRSYVHYTNELIDGVLSNHACAAFLKEVSKELRDSRSRLRIGKLRRRKSVKVLEQIQTFFDWSVGIPTIVAELRDRSQPSGLLEYECEKFTAPGWEKDDERRLIGKYLRDQIHFLSTRILAEEHSTREHFEQLASVMSVRESVKAQHKMESLTWIALLVAAASLVVALLPLFDWKSQVETHSSSIGLEQKLEAFFDATKVGK